MKVTTKGSRLHKYDEILFIFTVNSFLTACTPVRFFITTIAMPVTSQPYDDSVANTFGFVEGEDVQKIYTCKEGCSGCCGPKTNIVLTSKRLLSRREESAGCCAKQHSDASIFLENIEVMREAAAQGRCGCLALLCACLTCTWPCLLCNMCCSCCCGGDRPKLLQVAVGHGYESLTFKLPDIGIAAVDITRAVMAAKRDKVR